MNGALVRGGVLPPTSPESLEKISIVEERIREYPQIEFQTEHVFHAGMYARTVRIAPYVTFTGVLVKVPTLLIAQGTFEVTIDDEFVRFSGYNVIPASAFRKQVYITLSEVILTMIFPTDAKTVEEAESQFTDETSSLLSRTQDRDVVIVTGE